MGTRTQDRRILYVTALFFFVENVYWYRSDRLHKFMALKNIRKTSQTLVGGFGWLLGRHETFS